MLRQLVLSALALLIPFVAATAASSSLISPATKLAPRIAVVASASATGRAEKMMGTALSQQLFQRNSPLAVRWNAAAQVQVYLHYSNGIPPRTEDLLALGASHVLISELLHVVQAWVPAGQLYALAALPEITRITVPHYAVVKRSPQPVAIPRTGSVDTQGDQILGAAAFRQATGFNGSGISVGVISDGDNHIASSQSTGDLPATIWNDPNDAGTFKSSGDEGTAMMEIVYDLSPGVNLGFCGPATTADFVTCLTDFAGQFRNSKLVIADDLGFPGVAMFTDGGFATAVKNFATQHPNIQLVTAAGNDANSFWAGTWNPVNLPNAAINNDKPIEINGVTYTKAQNFGTNVSPNIQMSTLVKPGDTVQWTVQWGDTWVPSNQITTSTPNDPNDYDVVLVDGQGNILACNIGINVGVTASPSSSSTCTYQNNPTGPTNTPGPQPIQGNQWTNDGTTAEWVYLEILYAANDGVPDANLKVLLDENHGLTPRTAAGSIYGQAALPYPYEITAGADSASSPDTIEPYSSQGPVFFSQPSAGTSIRLKPDFVGVDCVQTTGAGGFPEPFCGTSAAAPHIAGLIALLESGFPNDNPYNLLKAGATALGNGTPNSVYGYGLPNVLHSAATIYPAPTASISAPSGSMIITAGQLVNFSGTCSANGAPGTVSYDWNFGSSIPDSNVQNPSVSFTTSGQFDVTLTCANAFGATAAASRNVMVNPNPSSGGGGGGGALGLLALTVLALMQFVAARRQ